MRKSYDFSKSVQNPYAERLKQDVTIPIDRETIAYFKEMAEQKGISYESRINLYLRDCATQKRQLEMDLIYRHQGPPKAIYFGIFVLVPATLRRNAWRANADKNKTL